MRNSAAAERKYQREYKQAIRDRVYPPHDYAKCTHCRACAAKHWLMRSRARKALRAQQEATEQRA